MDARGADSSRGLSLSLCGGMSQETQAAMMRLFYSRKLHVVPAKHSWMLFQMLSEAMSQSVGIHLTGTSCCTGGHVLVTAGDQGRPLEMLHCGVKYWSMHQHNENRVLRILWIAMHMHDALVAADFCSAAFAVYHTANLSELIFS